MPCCFAISLHGSRWPPPLGTGCKESQRLANTARSQRAERNTRPPSAELAASRCTPLAHMSGCEARSNCQCARPLAAVRGVCWRRCKRLRCRLSGASAWDPGKPPLCGRVRVDATIFFSLDLDAWTRNGRTMGGRSPQSQIIKSMAARLRRVVSAAESSWLSGQVGGGVRLALESVWIESGRRPSWAKSVASGAVVGGRIAFGQVGAWLSLCRRLDRVPSVVSSAVVSAWKSHRIGSRVRSAVAA